MILPDRPAWQAQAACVGLTALFFPTQGESTFAAKAVCRTCPVRDECREASVGEHFGIWAGTSERERRMGRREGAERPGPVLRPIRHGTPSGAQTHRRRGEKPCAACAAAWHTYNAIKKRESRARLSAVPVDAA